MRTGRTATYALLALATLTAVAGIAAGCSGTDEPPKEKSAKPAAEESMPAKDQDGGESAERSMAAVAGQKSRVAAAARIDEIRKGEAPDFSEISRIFETELQSTVAKRDKESGTTMVDDIESAIAAAVAAADSGESQAINGQRISKNLHRAFYLSVKHEFDEAEANFADQGEDGASHKFDEAEAYFPGTGAEMTDAVKAAFADGHKAIEAQDMLAFKLAAQIVDKAIIGHFISKVIGEAEDAVAEPGEAEEKLVEAQLFYAVVADKFKEQDAAISGLLSHGKGVDVGKLKTLLRTGLIQKARAEASEVLPEWGGDKAAVVGLEARLYLSMLEAVDKAEVAGESSVNSPEMLSDLEALQSAASSGDKSAAEALVTKVDAAMAAALK